MMRRCRSNCVLLHPEQSFMRYAKQRASKMTKTPQSCPFGCCGALSPKEAHAHCEKSKGSPRSTLEATSRKTQTPKSGKGWL